MKRNHYGLLVVVLWGALITPVFAQVEPEGNSLTLFDDKVTLQGLKKVLVAVTIYGTKTERSTSLKDLVTTTVELKLRKNGISVISGEWLETPGFPMLHARVLLYEVKGDGPSGEYVYFYSISLFLRQAVLLKRDPHIASGKNEAIMATTWGAGDALRYTPRTDLREKVRGTVGDLVDKFLNDYLAENPK